MRRQERWRQRVGGWGRLALQGHEPCCDVRDAVRLQERRAEGRTGILDERVRQVVGLLLRTAGKVNHRVGYEAGGVRGDLRGAVLLLLLLLLLL